MRTLFSILLSVIFLSAAAQKIEKPYQKDEDDKIIVTLNNDTWRSVPDGIELRPISIGIDINNFMDLKFGHSNFSLGVGWGFSSLNVHHNGYFKDTATATSPYTALLPLATKFEKNKFTVSYFDIPLELRFKTKSKRTFRLMAGFKAGIHLSDHVKIIDDEGKRKYYNIKYIKKYRYGLSARIGWGDINFTAFYSLTSIFEDGNGPDLKPLSIGFSIIPF